MDVLNAQTQQRQKHDYGLLFVPSDVKDNRQVVDILCLEDFLQFHSDHSPAVAIVALSGVEHAWNAVDIAQV